MKFVSFEFSPGPGRGNGGVTNYLGWGGMGVQEMGGTAIVSRHLNSIMRTSGGIQYGTYLFDDISIWKDFS